MEGLARHDKLLGQQRLADAGYSLKRDEGSWRWSRLVEPSGIFALIMAEIWWPRSCFTASWLVILGLILLSHKLHREEAVSLGFCVTNLQKCLDEVCPPLLFVVLVLLSAGILLQTTRNISFEQGLMSLGVYYPWGLLQQYLLNCYFANRLQSFTPNPRHVPLLSALFFSGAHLPNWFLMLVTFPAGYACVKVYMKYRNLYFLGLAHGTIGFLLFLVVPDSISHHLKVGPSWFR